MITVRAQNRNPALPGTIHETFTNHSQERLSPGARMLVHELNIRKNSAARMRPDSTFMNRFAIRRIGSADYVGALIKVNGDFNAVALDTLGVIIGSKINNIWSVKIPVNKLTAFSSLPGIDYLQTDHQVSMKLDSARKATGVDSVQQGIFLPHKYDGKGVIVGIIDGGFDYTQPTFYDTSGTTLRIKRVWNQNGTGTPPAGFSYGNELTNTSDMLSAGTSNANATHGTHVAGIAAGSGYGTNGRYRGMAPNADLVFVQIDNSLTGIQDGIAYISNYAQSVHEPAVINMSLGSHLGPHDGTSLMDQAIDSYSDHVIIVGAAGNEGDIPLHLTHTFSIDTIQSSITFESSSGFQNNGSGEIDIWGTAGLGFSVSIKVYNLTATAIDSSAYISTSSNTVTSFTLASGAVHVDFSADANNAFNNKPEMLISVSNNSTIRFVSLKIAAASGTVHAWNDGQGIGAPFTNKTPLSATIPGWKSGDINNTVGEIGGTANRIITIGAYVTKDQYTDLAGDPVTTFVTKLNVGDLAPYSSHGPTVDGRLKPDITAPGALIVSSLNSFDTDYGPTNNAVVDQVIQGSNTWYFGALQGTSMSTPMVTGIVALMLEADPTLTPEQVRDTLKVTSITDSFTGIIPVDGSNLWGWGKIDAYKAVNSMITGKPATPVISASTPLSFCPGEHAILSGPEGYKYWWSNGDTTRQISLSASATVTLRIGIPDGPWSDVSDPVTVTEREPPVLEIDSLGLTSFCAGDSVVLTIGQNVADAYAWYKGQDLISGTDTSVIIKSSGVYHAQTNDPNICTAVSDSILVSVDSLPVKPVITNIDNLLRSDADSSNQWFYTNEMIPGAVSDSFRVIKSGSYFVRTGSGCYNYSDTLEILTRPQIDIAGSTEFCIGDSVLLSGPAGYAIKWISGDTSQQLTVKNSGIYYLNITDQYGLTSDNSDTINVVVHNLPSVHLSFAGSLEFCQGDSVKLSVNGNPSYKYQWLNSDSVDLANDSTLNVKTSGRYFTVASDTNQCINYSDTLTVTVKSNPQKPTIVFDKNYLLTDTQESVQWYFNNDTIPGAVTDTLAVNDPGNYYLTVTSDSGCIAISDTRKVTILAFENPRLSDPVIYPNPAGNYIRIRSAIRGPVQLRIVSPGGDVYRNSNVLLNGNDVLDLSGMTPGLYILNIIKDEKIYSAKFIRK